MQIQTDQVEKTQLALKKAKQALINYALVGADINVGRSGKFGFLPCPDYTNALNEGFQDGNCGATNTNIVGWLPNVTLGLPRLRDSTGTCLLYAVSGAYKQSPETSMLNEDTNGQFQIVDDSAIPIPIQGVLPADRIVAIVFAPSKVLTGQARTFAAGSDCGEDYGNVTAYLEGDGVTNNAVLNGAADSIDQFIRFTPTSDEEANPYNDNFITITREELWTAINARNDFTEKMTDLTEALAWCLSAYVNNGVLADDKRMPWPAPIMLSDYRINSEYDDEEDRYAGRFPFLVDSSNVETNLVVANIFDSVGCESLNLISGTVVNLSDFNTEYRRLWENWKDHFFYALSSKFDPKSGNTNCGGSCIDVDGTQYAGVVFFGGSRLGNITRNAPPIDTDDKNDVSNYLENGNDTEINTAVGDNTDIYTLNTTNDIMFCLSDAVPPVVALC
ncbi:MAG: hypothetical protein JKX75_10145 [Gammaproteobacteria bacterium]|nr:hypothetical protein [Gammaproteobacteria bacterium]